MPDYEFQEDAFMSPSKDKYFTNSKDVEERLKGGVVKWKGDFYYVQDTDGMAVLLCPLPFKKSAKKSTVNANSKNLFTKNIPLGYINLHGTTVFLTRSSLKQTKSAPTANLIGYFTSNGTFHNITKETLLSTAFYETLINNYPSFTNALAEINGFDPTDYEYKSIAFHKNYAIFRDSKNRFLEMQGENIGILSKKGELILNKEYNNSFTVMKIASFGIPVLN